MDSLIERIEAATSNDPELFWEAFRAVHGEKPERVHGGSKELDDYLAKSNPFFFMLKAGAFIDAAMTLVPTYWNWSLTHSAWEREIDQRSGPPEYSAHLLYRGRRARKVLSEAATPALALCAAALKALSLYGDER